MIAQGEGHTGYTSHPPRVPRRGTPCGCPLWFFSLWRGHPQGVPLQTLRMYLRFRLQAGRASIRYNHSTTQQFNNSTCLPAALQAAPGTLFRAVGPGDHSPGRNPGPYQTTEHVAVRWSCCMRANTPISSYGYQPYGLDGSAHVA